jgi:hypothetical protein
MSTDVTGVTTLSHGAIRMFCAICVDLVGTVVLLIRFTYVARQIGTNLGTHTGAVANLYVLDLGTDFDDLANDLVTYAKWKRDILAPAASNCVDVRGTDTAGIDGDINIVLLELLERKLKSLSATASQWTWNKLTSLRVNSLHFLMSVTAKASVVSG